MRMYITCKTYPFWMQETTVPQTNGCDKNRRISTPLVLIDGLLRSRRNNQSFYTGKLLSCKDDNNGKHDMVSLYPQLRFLVKKTFVRLNLSLFNIAPPGQSQGAQICRKNKPAAAACAGHPSPGVLLSPEKFYFIRCRKKNKIYFKDRAVCA